MPVAAAGGVAGAWVQELRGALKEIPPGEKYRRQMKDSTNLANVMTVGEIMRTMEERNWKNEEKAAQKAAKDASRTRMVAASENGQFAAPQALAGPHTSVRPRSCPGRHAVRFQTVDPTIRLLRSATSSAPRPNYYLPLLAELEPEVETELENEGAQNTAPRPGRLLLTRTIASAQNPHFQGDSAPLDRVAPQIIYK